MSFVVFYLGKDEFLETRKMKQGLKFVHLGGGNGGKWGVTEIRNQCYCSAMNITTPEPTGVVNNNLIMYIICLVWDK